MKNTCCWGAPSHDGREVSCNFLGQDGIPCHIIGFETQEACNDYSTDGAVLLRRAFIYAAILGAMIGSALWWCFR